MCGRTNLGLQWVAVRSFVLLFTHNHSSFLSPTKYSALYIGKALLFVSVESLSHAGLNWAE